MPFTHSPLPPRHLNPIRIISETLFQLHQEYWLRFMSLVYDTIRSHRFVPGPNAVKWSGPMSSNCNLDLNMRTSFMFLYHVLLFSY